MLPAAASDPTSSTAVTPPPRRGAGIAGVLTALAAALVVGLAGGFASPAVWGLALASGISFHSLRRRAREEGSPDADSLGAFLQIAFLALLCAAAYDHRDDGAHAAFGAAHVVGLALIGAGVWLRQRAVVALGSQFTVRLQVAPDHRLVRSGPYRVVRHPNYAGLLLVACGTAIAFSSPLALLVTALLLLPAMLARIVQEERLLARKLGDDFTGYARTTWRLVPGVF